MLGSGNFTEVGKGKGEGFVVNIPWDTPGGPNAEAKITDADYLYAFENIVSPITREFAPELIIICAGFDAMKGDKIGKISLSPWIYYWMTKELMDINPRIVVTLEGGYNLKMLTKGVDYCLKALLGVAIETPKEMYSDAPSKEATETVEKVKSIHQKYWSCIAKAVKHT